MSLDNENKRLLTFSVTNSDGHPYEITLPADEAKSVLQKMQAGNDDLKRREALTRRPSYRKIYDDLSSNACIKQEDVVVSSSPGQHQVAVSLADPNRKGVGLMSDTSGSRLALGNNCILQIPGGQSLSASGAGQTLQINQGATNLQAAMNLGNQQTTLLQYTQSDGTSVYIPVSLASSLSTAIPQASQMSSSQNQMLGSPSSSSGMTSSNQLMFNSDSMSPPLGEGTGKKREVRLLKNREAARECRRKKKEYVKCLENRVAILEAQNQKLIDELHKLRTFCTKDKQQQVIMSPQPIRLPTVSSPACDGEQEGSTIVSTSSGPFVLSNALIAAVTAAGGSVTTPRFVHQATVTDNESNIIEDNSNV